MPFVPKGQEKSAKVDNSKKGPLFTDLAINQSVLETLTQRGIYRLTLCKYPHATMLCITDDLHLKLMQ